MATAPTRAFGVTPAVGWASTSRPKTSPAFDVQAGDLIVLVAFSEDSAFPLASPTWTGTGDWTLRQSVVVGGYCTAYLYTCAVTATATGRTISQDRTGGASGGQWSFYASGWRNHGGLGVTGKANASGAPALTLATSANSAVVVGNSDWTASSGTRTWRTVNGSPLIETSFGGTAGVTYMCYSGYSPDIGPAGSLVFGMTAPSGQKYSIVGVEILGTAAAPNVTTSATAPLGLTALGVPFATRTTAGATAPTHVGAAATTARQAATAALASARMGASATSLAAHASHAFATARAAASATTQTTRAAAANAAAGVQASATVTSTRQIAGTAPTRATASADTATVRVTSGTAGLQIGAEASTSAATPHTTTGTAAVGNSAAATTTTGRAVRLSAGLSLAGLANHTTERHTDGLARVAPRAEGFTGAHEVHTTTGTASIEATATAATSTARAGASTAALETKAVYTLQAEHRTASAATGRIVAFSATTTVHTTARTAPVALSATSHSSNPGAWVDVDLVVSEVAGNPLTVTPPVSRDFAVEALTGHPLAVSPPEA